MSQKKAKLLNKFIKATGQDKTGQQWQESIGFNEKTGKEVTRIHTLRDDKRIKRAYKDSNYRQKTAIGAVMLSVIKKNDKTKTTSM